MSEVNSAQSSKALACVTMPSGAMTSTPQVINSTSSSCFDGAMPYRSHTSLLTFVSSVFRSTSTCMCNSVCWYLGPFLHIGGEQHLLAMCPHIEQFLHRAPFLTMSHRSFHGMSWNLLQVPSGWVPSCHTRHMLPQLWPCRTYVWSSAAFA